MFADTAAPTMLTSLFLFFALFHLQENLKSVKAYKKSKNFAQRKFAVKA